MSRVEEIEQAIEQFDPHEFSVIRARFNSTSGVGMIDSIGTPPQANSLPSRRSQG